MNTTIKTPSLVFASIKAMSQQTEFIPTGFKKLDDELDGGFMRKELIVLGGYTGSGKSYLAGQIALSAVRDGFNCGYFSLEISAEMIVSRLIGAEANIKPSRIMAGLLTPPELKAKEKAMGTLMAYDKQLFFIDDTYQLTLIDKIIRENKFDLVIIDFIQNVMSRGDEYEKLSNTALTLQKLAKDTNCTILVISQLSNEAYKTGALEYKGSGSIATVCDLGMFLVRDEEETSQMSLTVRKNRRGYSGFSLNLQSTYPGGKIYGL